MNKKYSDRRPLRASMVAIAFLAASLTSPIISCARKSDSPSAPRASSSAKASAPQKDAGAPAGAEALAAAKAAAAAGAAVAGSTAPETRRARQERQTQPKPAATLAAGLRAYGLGARPVPRMPEDFSLGPLQSLKPGTKAEKGALSTALSFLDGLASGKQDASLFLPEARNELAALLAPVPAQDGEKMTGARVGVIAIEGDAASLRVRLPAPEHSARTEGLLSLREREGSWYVESLALDPPSSAALAFAPGADGIPR